MKLTPVDQIPKDERLSQAARADRGVYERRR